MTAAPARSNGTRYRGTGSTVALVGFLTITPMAYGLVRLPVTEGVPLGALAWSVVGGLAALWRGTLVASLAGTLTGMAVAVVGYAGVSRAFTNTPWEMTPDRFALLFGMTVALAVAAVAAGYVLVSFLRGGAPFAGTRRRGVVGVLVVGVAVVAGGTLFAQSVQAVIPFGANRPTVVMARAGAQLSPSTFASGPTYWTFRNVDLPGSVDQPGYEVGILRIGSDAELALRLTGKMGGTYESGSRVLGWVGIPTIGTSGIRRGDLQPGRYLLLVVKALPPVVEGGGTIGGEDADRVVVDGLHIEFTVTN